MKKLISLALVMLLLLNVMGFYGVFVGLRLEKTRAMIQQFDAADYDENQTLTFQIPLALPYAKESNEFVRVDGQFEHNGEFYRMIKQKLSNDTLTVVVFKDRETKKLHDVESSFAKSFTDTSAENSSNVKVSLSFIKDYISNHLEIEKQSTGWENTIANNNSHLTLVPTFYSSIIHPPERG